MRQRFWLLPLAAVAAIGASCGQTQVKTKTATGTDTRAPGADLSSPPSATQAKPAQPSVDKPLLLEDGSGSSTANGSGADNTRCQVCHLNLAQEELAVTHAQANVGCAKCHGPSDAHIADESWASGGQGTAPDIMFPREKINPFCLECHPKDKIDTGQHQDLFAGQGEEECCIDCHGKHRLVHRKCKWK